MEFSDERIQATSVGTIMRILHKVVRYTQLGGKTAITEGYFRHEGVLLHFCAGND